MTFSRVLCSGIAVCLLISAAPASAQWTWTPETGRFVNMGNLPKETPELQVEYTRSLVVGGQLSKAMDETKKFTEFYPDTEYADDNQFLRGKIRLAQEDYVKAAEEFQQVITVYPESPLYDDVISNQYEIGDALFEKGRKRFERTSKGFRPWRPITRFNPFRRRPLKKAIDVYTMVIDNQPFTPEAAEAQYKTGLCYFTREEYLEAGFEFRRVLEDYAESEWVREASFHLTRAYEEAALGPDYDQAPSKLAIGSIGAFSRRYPADSRVTERREVSQKMRETIAEQRYRTARFYEKRRRLDSARIYYEIVAGEFEGTEAAEKAKKWLAENPPDGKAHTAFVGPAVLR